jgi:hypothetical protein
VLAAKRQMRQRPFRAGKIDEDIEVIFNRIQAALYGDAGLSCARQLTGIGPRSDEPSRSSAAPSARHPSEVPPESADGPYVHPRPQWRHGSVHHA